MIKRKMKSDLLEMSETERTKLIREVRQKLQQKVIESKLQQMLLEAEKLTVDGNTLYNEKQRLSGFCLDRLKNEILFHLFK